MVCRQRGRESSPWIDKGARHHAKKRMPRASHCTYRPKRGLSCIGAPAGLGRCDTTIAIPRHDAIIYGLWVAPPLGDISSRNPAASLHYSIKPITTFPLAQQEIIPRRSQPKLFYLVLQCEAWRDDDAKNNVSPNRAGAHPCVFGTD